MPTDRKKAPEGCYWRGSSLWTRFIVSGRSTGSASRQMIQPLRRGARKDNGRLLIRRRP